MFLMFLCFQESVNLNMISQFNHQCKTYFLTMIKFLKSLFYYIFYINRIIKRIIKPYWKPTLIYCILKPFWFCTFDFLCRKFLLKCLQKFQKTQGFRTQFFLKKLNSLTMKSNRNVYIDIMINYTLAITKWKQFYEVGAIFTVVQLFLARPENQI